MMTVWVCQRMRPASSSLMVKMKLAMMTVMKTILRLR